jgi:peptide/nickel transport system ATP-binding protein
VFITHDLGIMRNLADRTVVMWMGKVVEQGPTEEIFTPPQADGYMRKRPCHGNSASYGG